MEKVHIHSTAPGAGPALRIEVRVALLHFMARDVGVKSCKLHVREP
jgi:hypothetical protein